MQPEPSQSADNERPPRAGTPTPARSSTHQDTRAQPAATAPLHLVVDLNRCQAYAQCCFMAPDVFQLHGEEALWYDPSPDRAQREHVLSAAAACPVQAIAVEVGAAAHRRRRKHTGHTGHTERLEPREGRHAAHC
jgi:ferredoxin